MCGGVFTDEGEINKGCENEEPAIEITVCGRCQVRPGTGVADPDAASIDPDAASIDPDTVSIDPDTASIDPDAVSIDPVG